MTLSMSSSPILGSSPSSPRLSVFEVSRWSTTWFDDDDGVDSIFVWGNIYHPPHNESQPKYDAWLFLDSFQTKRSKSPPLTSPSQVPGSCFTSRCSILTRAPFPRLWDVDVVDPRSELESGNIGCDVSSAGSCLIVGGEMVFVTPHFFTSTVNLSVTRKRQN